MIMQRIYQEPKKVFFVLAFLAVWGLYSAFSLNVSLFPKNENSVIGVELSYGELTSESFFNTYGQSIEASLRGLAFEESRVVLLEASYNTESVSYELAFDWGKDPVQVVNYVKATLKGTLGYLPKRIFDSLRVRDFSSNSGYFLAGVKSKKRSDAELIKLISKDVYSLTSHVPEADFIYLTDPTVQELVIRFDADQLIKSQLNLAVVENQLRSVLRSVSLGSVLDESIQQKVEFRMLSPTLGLEELKNLEIPVPGSSKRITLGSLASIELEKNQEGSRKFFIQKLESIVVYAVPKPGANIKSMGDNLKKGLEKLKKNWPDDIEVDVLINPSFFIDRSIKGVAFEVILAGGMAVLVLFFFIGSLRNIVTAAIEIPLSLILAFILMKQFDVNVNLISLAGLALSAGMNVDASIVVLENILRVFKEKLLGSDDVEFSHAERFRLIVKAVQEVLLPLFSSTLISLVVFAPLIMTTGITQSLLGDLAQAVVFSHGLSLLVALVLVPSIRLITLKNVQALKAEEIQGFVFFKKAMLWLNEKYALFLELFFNRFKIRLGVSLFVAGLFVLAFGVFLPKLPKELMARPESDWLVLNLYLDLSPSVENAKLEALHFEDQVIEELGSSSVVSTLNQVSNANSIQLLVKIKEQSRAQELIEKLKQRFKSKDGKYYRAEMYNPSELNLPEAYDFSIEIGGSSSNQNKFDVLGLIDEELRNHSGVHSIELKPWMTDFGVFNLAPQNLGNVNDYIANRDRVQETLSLALNPSSGYTGLVLKNPNDAEQMVSVRMEVDKTHLNSVSEIRAMPVFVDKKLVPLGALYDFRQLPTKPQIYRRNNQETFFIKFKKVKDSDTAFVKEEFIDRVETKIAERLPGEDIKLEFVDPNPEISSAILELTKSLGLSFLVIFFVLFLQFSWLREVFAAMLPIPFGILGVIISLYVFNSTLSLNSVLGMILLSGIAIANSILIIDAANRLREESNISLQRAFVLSASMRLRPILMTSLTTLFGMLPMALGIGQGGAILQPLGISVCGGLFFSLILTLIYVPWLGSLKK